MTSFSQMSYAHTLLGLCGEVLTVSGVRLNGQKAEPKRDQRPYQTDRWRLDELQVAPVARKRTQKTLETEKADVATSSDDDDAASYKSLLPPSNQLCTVDAEQYGKQLVSTSSKWPPSSLLSDHLLHLVNFNAFRGFYANKYMLSHLTKHFKPSLTGTEEVDIMKFFPEQTFVVPLAKNIPRCLTPTPTQRAKVHATWIDVIPFPRMRDNLIAQHDDFDHWDLMKDVIGELLDEPMFPVRGAGAGAESRGSRRRLRLALRVVLDADEVTAGRKGLILWGEPFREESWEATPGFLEKWAWTVEGCDGLLESTNRWRVLRGEEPIQVVM